MAYVSGNPRTKKAFKETVASGEDVYIWQPSPWGDAPVKDGTAYVEGPQYPEAHKWYATVVVKDGKVVSVK